MMTSKINTLALEFLESKKTKEKKYRKDFSYSQLNNILKIIFDSTDDLLFEKIILADKSTMLEYIVKYKQYLSSNGYEHKSIEKLKGSYSRRKLIKQLSKLHNAYDSFSSTWNYKIVQALNIKTCLYCNRESVLYFNITDKNGKKEPKTTAEIDHYYPRSLYPFLSISFHNLIPSCKTCNSKFKGDRDTHRKEILYPYEENLNDNMSFKYKGIKTRKELKKQNLNFFNEKRVQFTIEPNSNQKKIEEHIDLFQLQTLYEEHRDTISELLEKRVIYSDAYIDSLIEQYEGTLFKNREDLLRLITCGYVIDEDINKRPLSKLIKDISQELGLI